MPDLGDIPVLARGAIPGTAGRVSGGAPDGADPGPAPGLVWLEDGLEVPFRDAGAPRPWPEASSDAPDAPVERLRPRDHREEDEPPTLLWV